MVDFKKVIKGGGVDNKIDPIEIYESLDRESDKGPLRPVQKELLEKWTNSFKNEKDVILKLHTGQGKTLIGLLILQSKLNQFKEPALYLCPNNHLVDQTTEQAKQFGLNVVNSEGDLPQDFLDGKSILVTNVQKLFNGFSQFGLDNNYTSVNTIVIDDAHACIETIRDQFVIKIESDKEIYTKLFELFADDIKEQGAGTFYEIFDKEFDSFLPVPYWSWISKNDEVYKIISDHRNEKYIKFKWPLLKDILKDCNCIISGSYLEIIPMVAPINLFSTYSNASHRLFMSATINDDSFLIRNLGVSINAIKKPLRIEKEKWSGEKMILIPTLIHNELEKDALIPLFTRKPTKTRTYGIVTLVPSYMKSKQWEKNGAVVINSENIAKEIEVLKSENCEYCIVFANRYDGIDLPDKMCRILIIDSKPYFQTLTDRNQERCRKNSNIIKTKIAQKIEQGLGRAVRGEKDYCIIVLFGADLIKFIRSKETSKFFSLQTQKQINIGLKIADLAKSDIDDNTPVDVIINLVNQSLSRKPEWKEFYNQEMNTIEEDKFETDNLLEILELERESDEKFLNQDYDGSVEILQLINDKYITDDHDKGWYLQEMARVKYFVSKSESNSLQIAAHKKNKFLLKPENGMDFSKLKPQPRQRVENISTWIKESENFEELKLKIDELTSNLSFGIDSDKFEESLNDLAQALGFVSERPDNEWKEGPDNLWGINDNEFILFECKNGVKKTRVEIYKDETGQMNNSCAWFKEKYATSKVKNIMIIPARSLGKGAVFSEEVELMREKQLKKLTRNVNSFFMEFKNVDFRNISIDEISKWLKTHSLDIESLKNEYSVSPN